MIFRKVLLVLTLYLQVAAASHTHHTRTSTECGGYLENVAVGFEVDAHGQFLKAGQIPRNLPGGITRISGWRNTRHGSRRALPMVFDTNNPTGGDFDLRRRWWGNVLIMSENGNSADPKANRRGATFQFDFNRPVYKINWVNFIDARTRHREPVEIETISDSGTKIKRKIPIKGDFSFPVEVRNVRTLIVRLPGDGAISSMNLEVCKSCPRGQISPRPLDRIKERRKRYATCKVPTLQWNEDGRMSSPHDFNITSSLMSAMSRDGKTVIAVERGGRRVASFRRERIGGRWAAAGELNLHSPITSIDGILVNRNGRRAVIRGTDRFDKGYVHIYNYARDRYGGQPWSRVHSISSNTPYYDCTISDNGRRMILASGDDREEKGVAQIFQNPYGSTWNQIGGDFEVAYPEANVELSGDGKMAMMTINNREVEAYRYDTYSRRYEKLGQTLMLAGRSPPQLSLSRDGMAFAAASYVATLVTYRYSSSAGGWLKVGNTVGHRQEGCRAVQMSDDGLKIAAKCDAISPYDGRYNIHHVRVLRLFGKVWSEMSFPNGPHKGKESNSISLSGSGNFLQVDGVSYRLRNTRKT